VAPADSRSEDLSPRARQATWTPKSHTGPEIEEARRVLAHWNKTFRGVAGATLAQLGNMSNVRHYIRVLRRCSRGAGSDVAQPPSAVDPFSKITADHVRAAITAYRADAGCNKLKSWKRFRDWLDPETILKYCGTGFQPVDPRRVAALKIIEYRALNRAVRAAESMSLSLSRHIRDSAASRLYRNNPGHALWMNDLRDLLDRYEAASSHDRACLAEGARFVFAAAHGRAAHAAGDDNALMAIAMALLDLDRTSLQPWGSTRLEPCSAGPDSPHA
jgi:hypothetical protein